MNISAIKQFDVSNGPGIRVSVFVSGCSIHCKGCHNQDAWDFNYGEPFSESVLQKILDYCNSPQISGISILGGEPLDEKNREDVFTLIKAFRHTFGESKSVWLWTGHTLEKLKHENSTTIHNILQIIDTLVDGPFVESLRDVSLKFRGSSNQRILVKS